MRIRRALLALLLAVPAAARLRVSVPEIGRAPAPALGAGAAVYSPPAPAPAALAPALAPSLAAPSAQFSPGGLLLTDAPVPLKPVPAAATPLQRSGAGVQLLLDLARTPQEREAANFTAAFDGAKAPKEGAAVYPSIISDRALLAAPIMLAVARDAVQKVLPALKRSVSLGDWNGPNTTLDESCCGDAAPKLAALLRSRGIPARLVEAEFHYYVMVETPDAQLVIDPTIRQFFGKRQAPRAIPEVFVGTTGELAELFDRHRGAKTTRYGALRVYFADSVVREKQLLELEQEIYRGKRKDLLPLRAAMGLETPPAERPKLIVP